MVTLHSQWADLSRSCLHSEALSVQQSLAAESAGMASNAPQRQDSAQRFSSISSKGPATGDSLGITAGLDGMMSNRVKDFSVDDILAETASLVSIPTDLDDPGEHHFGGFVPNIAPSSSAWSLPSASGGQPPARQAAAYEHTDSLVADADSMTELRVENVALRARVDKLEEELGKYKSMASSSALAQTQYVHINGKPG